MPAARDVAVALIAFVAGAVVGGLVVDGVPSRDDAAAPHSVPTTESPRRPAEKERPAPAPRAGRSEKTPLEEAAPTSEEQTWLRDALLRERERRASAVIRDEDGGLDILDRWAKSRADVGPLVASYDAMRRHVRAPEGPSVQLVSTGDETAVDLSALDSKTAVVEFGPGRFVLSDKGGLWKVRRADVEALEVRGAGIDRTTLVGPGWAFLMSNEGAAMKNLVLRDFTIDSKNPGQIVLDARGRMSIAAERVRFLGWDVSGHAAAVGVSGAAYLAFRDCDFAGPGAGFALSLRGGAVCVFEHCRIADVNSAVIGTGADSLGRPSVVVLRDCAFEDARLTDSRTRAGAAEISVRGGTVAFGAKSWTDDERRKKWGTEFASAIDGVSFGPAVPRFTVADLLRVLDAAPGQGIGAVVEVHVAPGGSGRPTLVELYAWDAPKATAVRRTFSWTNATLVPVPDDSRRGSRYGAGLTADEVAAYPTIADLVRRSGVASDEPVTRVEFSGQTATSSGGVAQATRWLQVAAESGTAWLIDARSGQLRNR